MTNESPWWEAFFDDLYANVELEARSGEATANAVEFICDRFGLRAGDLVFDQCCGIGRLTPFLAAHEVEVIGVDLSPSYVERATRVARDQAYPATYVCADAFEYVTPRPCRAAINWFTSFGYAQSDVHNQRMLRCAFESLAPGAGFVIDVANVVRALRRLPEPAIVRRATEDGGEMMIIMEVEPDLPRGMLLQRWTLIESDGRRHERRAETRILMPHELANLLVGVGFESVELLGGLDGEAFEMDSPRLMATARRPRT